MQGYSILSKVFNSILGTGLTAAVYHSAVIKEEDNGDRYPVYPLGKDESKYIGIDDTKEMIVYCRQIDDMRVLSAERLGSCNTAYKCSISHRLVFFNDYEKRNQDDLINKFLQSIFVSGVKLNRVIVDKLKLSQLETNGKAFNLGNTTFYFAIDFDITFLLQKDNCGKEIKCADVENPYCKYEAAAAEVVIIPEPVPVCDFNADFSADFQDCTGVEEKSYSNDFSNDFKNLIDG